MQRIGCVENRLGRGQVVQRTGCAEDGFCRQVVWRTGCTGQVVQGRLCKGRVVICVQERLCRGKIE